MRVEVMLHTNMQVNCYLIYRSCCGKTGFQYPSQWTCMPRSHHDSGQLKPAKRLKKPRKSKRQEGSLKPHPTVGLSRDNYVPIMRCYL